MIFQNIGDPCDISLCLGVLCLQLGKRFVGLLEKSEETFALFGLSVEAFQFANKVRDHVADFAKILCADIAQSCVRERGDFFLTGGSVVQNYLRIADIDLF